MSLKALFVMNLQAFDAKVFSKREPNEPEE
jgi:hypothetical protein